MMDGSLELVLSDPYGIRDMKTLLRTAIAVMASSLCVANSHAQGQWAFGDSGVSDRGERIHLAADGDLLVCSADDMMRLDGASSAVEWRVRVEGFYPQDIMEASDGRVAVSGLIFNSDGSSNLVLLFLDPLGNLINNRVFPGGNSNERHELIQTLDMGFMIAGEVVGDSGNILPMVIKTDTGGNLLWCKRYDMNDFPFGVGEFCDVEEERLTTGRSVFHLTGQFKADSLQKADTLMVTIDEFGSPLNSAYLGFQGFSDTGWVFVL